MSVTFAAIDTNTQQFAELDDINMNNNNAGRVLAELGFGDDVAAGDLCGTIPAEDFQRRCALARANVPSHDEYTRVRLNQLFELATAARELGYQVTWA